MILWRTAAPQPGRSKIKANERLRKELSAIKKQARERAKSVAIRIPKLVDCKAHYNELLDERRGESTIFLCEGNSAGGPMISSRDVYTQAIYTLKGKPLNTSGLRRDAVYKNEELYNVMRSGDRGQPQGLRYNRVVIATDADVDGMHIHQPALKLPPLLRGELVLRSPVHPRDAAVSRAQQEKARYCYGAKERPGGRGDLRPGRLLQRPGARSRQRVRAVHRTRDRLVRCRSPTWARLRRASGSCRARTRRRGAAIVDNLVYDVS